MIYCDLSLTLYFLALPGFGPAAYWKLRSVFSDLNWVFSQDPQVLSSFFSQPALDLVTNFQRNSRSCSLFEQVKNNMMWCEENDVHIVHELSEYYPALLREIKRAPPVLFIKGDVECLSLPQVAMVGSRSPSPLGKQSAYDFSGYLSSHGFIVTSGLALGVDTFAHSGAVKAGGKTIAVLGTGIDSMYPARNKVLASTIVDSGGAIVSEFALGTGPQSKNFPQRNRVISGLSYGTLVVEAAIKSGSLITARLAVQQNREVFAIPGSVCNPLSRGCHALIKEGALLVETAQDIVDELGGFLAGEWQKVAQQKAACAQHKLSPFHSSPQSSVNQTSTDRSPVNSNAVSQGSINQGKDDSNQGKRALDHPRESDKRDLNKNELALLTHIGFEATPVDVLANRANIPVDQLLPELMMLELDGFIHSSLMGYIRSK